MINLNIDSILDKFIPDANERQKAKNLIQNHAQEQMLAQIEVNKQEAAHKSLFVAGWRPAVGWVCVLGMLVNFVIVPLVPSIQPLDISEMMTVLLGLLGLGGMRTYEKLKGVSREK